MSCIYCGGNHPGGVTKKMMEEGHPFIIDRGYGNEAVTIGYGTWQSGNKGRFPITYYEQEKAK